MLFSKLFGKKPAADQVSGGVLEELERQISSFGHVQWARSQWLRALSDARNEIVRLKEVISGSHERECGKDLANDACRGNCKTVRREAAEDLPLVKKVESPRAGKNRGLPKPRGDRRKGVAGAGEVDGRRAGKPRRRSGKKP